METCRLTAPFGEVSLDVIVSGEKSFAPEISYGTLAPSLPEGMRVDGFRQVSCKLTPLPAGEVTILMAYALEPGYTAHPGNGEWLCAFDVVGPQLSGAIGMRDEEWFAAQAGIEGVEGVYDPVAQYTLKLRTAGAESLTIGLAAAWILNPSAKQNDDSPWFAVDSALSYE